MEYVSMVSIVATVTTHAKKMEAAAAAAAAQKAAAQKAAAQKK